MDELGENELPVDVPADEVNGDELDIIELVADTPEDDGFTVDEITEDELWTIELDAFTVEDAVPVFDVDDDEELKIVEPEGVPLALVELAMDEVA